MRKPTQKDKVRSKLNRDGFIENFWAMDNIPTIRLGAIIHELKKEGMDIGGDYLPGTKNFRYALAGGPKPRMRTEIIERDGIRYARLVPVEHTPN